MTNKEEIEQLFQANFRGLHKLACSILGDSEEARDVVSSVFVALLDGKITLPEGKGEAYLRSCVRNRCLDAVRQLSVKEKVMRHIALTAPDNTTVQEEAREHRLEIIRDCVETELTPAERRVFELRFGIGLKYRKIAERLDISETAVYRNLSRALTKIKNRVL